MQPKVFGTWWLCFFVPVIKQLLAEKVGEIFHGAIISHQFHLLWAYFVVRRSIYVGTGVCRNLKHSLTTPYLRLYSASWRAHRRCCSSTSIGINMRIERLDCFLLVFWQDTRELCFDEQLFECGLCSWCDRCDNIFLRLGQVLLWRGKGNRLPITWPSQHNQIIRGICPLASAPLSWLFCSWIPWNLITVNIKAKHSSKRSKKYQQNTFILFRKPSGVWWWWR